MYQFSKEEKSKNKKQKTKIQWHQCSQKMKALAGSLILEGELNLSPVAMRFVYPLQMMVLGSAAS